MLHCSVHFLKELNALRGSQAQALLLVTCFEVLRVLSPMMGAMVTASYSCRLLKAFEIKPLLTDIFGIPASPSIHSEWCWVQSPATLCSYSSDLGSNPAVFEEHQIIVCLMKIVLIHPTSILELPCI